MVQVEVLSGKKAGLTWAARRFPVRIGRSASADLQLEDDGVWDQHLRVDFDPAEGFVACAQPHALASLNGQPLQQAALRNGDILALGAIQLRFSLGPTRQAGLLLREWLTWAAIAAICLGQLGLIYWLLPGSGD